MFGLKKKAGALRDDIAAAAERGSINNAMFGRTLRGMEDRLMRNEQVLEMCQANHERRAGVLVRTNYRLWFTVDSIAGNTSDGIALERISSVRWTRDMGKRKGIGTLEVSTSGREARFALVPEMFATELQMATA